MSSGWMGRRHRRNPRILPLKLAGGQAAASAVANFARRDHEIGSASSPRRPRRPGHRACVRRDRAGAAPSPASIASMQPEGMGPDGGPEGTMREHDEGARANPTTPELLDMRVRRMREHEAAFERHAEAAKALYAALSPTQQRTFDALAKMMLM